jgi:hypothetical protein
MDNQYCALVKKKLSNVKFISISANEVEFKQSSFVGQVAFMFPKVGKMTLYVSMITPQLFVLISNNGRMSQSLTFSKDLNEISEAAITAFEMVCIAEKIDVESAKLEILKAC